LLKTAQIPLAEESRSCILAELCAGASMSATGGGRAWVVDVAGKQLAMASVALKAKDRKAKDRKE